MNLRNVRLILFREIRDQLRDRRTLFMIFVLPLLLYPLLGMSLLQVVQFRRPQPSNVLAVNLPRMAGLPPLADATGFDRRLFPDDSQDAELLKLVFSPQLSLSGSADGREAARRAVQSGNCDAALYFPPEFAARLAEFQKAVLRRDASKLPAVPSPEIIYTTANERSQIASARLHAALQNWIEALGKSNLRRVGVPAAAVRPFDIEAKDVAAETAYRGAALWSKILPVMLLIWAMTGAFYPAVDLCAGEKERGTLETLLSSPAERSEIVLGKLLTIMVFSMATAALNLLSMGAAGWLIFARATEFGPPPPLAPLWLSLALLPISALYSALCLALAALARSTREGQYYLVPLLLVTTPLAVLPMAPGVELNLGNSLIPITGVVLLLRSTIEGSYWQALQYLPVVLGVTLTACFLAVRWAVDQFNSETVLFRESERLDIGLWLRRLAHDRHPTPSVAAAVFCGLLILLIRFVIEGLSRPEIDDFAGIARMTVGLQLAAIATPALFMSLLLTSSPRQTLLLRLPRWPAIPAAAALAVAVHPVVNFLPTIVARLYPLSPEVQKALQQMEQILAHAPRWQLILVLAVVPAICEELAFRGFILSGLRHIGHRWRAIAFSAVFFAAAHGVLQQSLIACFVGVIIGILAVQTESLLPCVLFHLVHNSLGLAAGWCVQGQLDRWPLLKRCATIDAGGGLCYKWPVVVGGGLAAILIIAWFVWLHAAKSPEEELQEAIDRGSHRG